MAHYSRPAKAGSFITINTFQARASIVSRNRGLCKISQSFRAAIKPGPNVPADFWGRKAIEAWKQADPKMKNPERLLAQIQKAREENTRNYRKHHPKMLWDENEAFNVRWDRAKRYWLTATFEFALAGWRYCLCRDALASQRWPSRMVDPLGADSDPPVHSLVFWLRPVDLQFAVSRGWDCLSVGNQSIRAFAVDRGGFSSYETRANTPRATVTVARIMVWFARFFWPRTPRNTGLGVDRRRASLGLERFSGESRGTGSHRYRESLASS